MSKIIYIGLCPYCHEQMPTPTPEILTKRYHPCLACGMKPRASKSQDRDGNWHVTYSDTRNSKPAVRMRRRVIFMPVTWDWMNAQAIREAVERGIKQ